ncbi:MAG: hypothetical protein A3F83_08525 [Candidatus Glassbacteria bacterium RIFCSPLOWO2_12_FULL_58_11]|uniref:Cyclic nucleotide-binding domain-containing protein n=1 Tax=Candidatus Glassbacteria bacterium RIFCSPLOWO2_12_FULL_58_11 TaxID=1817867 RepID=A0A1F5YYF7_9BACT|nr:MAG: hypothetical protein A3F83_08525 [Candidatus Glassbacteria bacterium RIFCSPLOWO2_12_FULL_58_11]
MNTIEKTFHKGEVIIKEGHFANSFYVINEGTVEVIKRKGDREVRLAVLGEHEFFGEMSLLDPEHSMHSATVRALETTRVTIMSQEDFERYLGTLTPGMRNLLRRLVARLRETSSRVTEDKRIAPAARPAEPEKAEGEPDKEQDEPDKEPGEPDKKESEPEKS